MKTRRVSVGDYVEFESCDLLCGGVEEEVQLNSNAGVNSTLSEINSANQ